MDKIRESGNTTKSRVVTAENMDSAIEPSEKMDKGKNVCILIQYYWNIWVGEMVEIFT